MYTTEKPRITIPLGREAHHLARQFAAEQASSQKGKQVYLNTLAVQAVDHYLQWLQVETDLSQGDSWHSGVRSLLNVADLVLPGIGKLECRPLLPGETVCSLPLEATEDRIGYVVVQLDESLREVMVLGFAPTVSIQELPISQLQPLEDLLEHLDQRMLAVATSDVAASQVLVNLSQWFENCFEVGWQSVEALFSTGTVHPALSTRSADPLRDDPNHSVTRVSGGKLIDLGLQLVGHPVALVVAIAPEGNREVNIRLRIYPAGSRIYLPPGLQLIVLDESGASCLEAEARNTDNWMQLEFSGEPREKFSVKLVLGDTSITEYFVI